MVTYKVKLNNVEQINDFVNAISSLEGKYRFVDEGIRVDAKSFMSIITLDLTKPLTLVAHNASETARRVIHPYLAA